MAGEYLGERDSDGLIGILCYKIATISKQKSEAMFQQASLDINSEQAWILTKAYEKLDEGVHQSDLVTQEQIIGAKSQVSRLIHDLVEKEYLVRRVDPNDRRQTYLTITNSGLERMHQVQDIVQKRKEVYLHTLTIDEYHTLVSLLKKALVGVKED
ncbi:MarR family winged helix-turn-helix transcriptional regulator [Photobacterium chitinilyticum]|nr:winged helix DNA-binding protein [Photobacterium chitinilyticum]